MGELASSRGRGARWPRRTAAQVRPSRRAAVHHPTHPASSPRLEYHDASVDVSPPATAHTSSTSWLSRRSAEGALRGWMAMDRACHTRAEAEACACASG